MERFCGSLLPAINTRKYPYRAIDRRIIELAQVTQIKNIYGLTELLDLSRKKKEERQGRLVPNCKQCFTNSTRRSLTTIVDDFTLVFPHRSLDFSPNLRKKMASFLSFKLVGSLELQSDILRLSGEFTDCWGKLKLRNEDMVHAGDLAEYPNGRDMNYVKVRFL
jgi:hypothetical protein